MLIPKDLAGVLSVALIIITFFLLILKRRNLGKNGGFFIAVIGIFAVVEGCATYYRSSPDHLDVAPIYMVGINFIIFLSFLLYFHGILEQRKLKNISWGLIILFIVQYALSAYFVRDFFMEAPLSNYFFGVAILSAGISLVFYQTFSGNQILALPHYFPFWAGISVMTNFVGVLPLLTVRYLVDNLHPTLFSGFLLLANFIGYTILLFALFKAKNNH